MTIPCIILAVVALGMFLPGGARAAGILYIVDSLGDNSASDGKCTLREAIISANASAPTDCGPANIGADGIEFGVSGTITLGSAFPTITDDLSLDGGNTITLSGNGANRIFFVNGKTLVLANLTLTKGKSATDGGAIFNKGILHINHSKFLDNHTDADSDGGAIASPGALTITDSEFANNSARSAGAVSVVGGTAALTIEGSNFHDNSASTASGAIGVSGGTRGTIRFSTFSHNQAGDAGAIGTTDATLSLTEVTLSRNSTNASFGRGGGINIGSGTVSLANVTLDANTAFQGGAMYLCCGNTPNSVTTLTNVTFSGNRADQQGGAIYDFAATANLTHVTFSGNSATHGGAIFWTRIKDDQTAGHITFKNTIFAKAASGGNCDGDDGVGVGWRSADFNDDDDGNCMVFQVQAHDIFLNPMLAPLADNGGTTKTHLPAANSPVIDAGTCVTALSADQRGVLRPQGARCDIGSVEVVPPPPTATRTATRTPTRTPTRTSTRTATRANTPTPTPTKSCQTKPAEPTLRQPPNHATLSTTRPTLKWNAALCALTYTVIVKDAETGKRADKNAGSAVLKYKVTPLLKGHTYKWFVKACSKAFGCAKSASRILKIQ